MKKALLALLLALPLLGATNKLNGIRQVNHTPRAVQNTNDVPRLVFGQDLVCEVQALLWPGMEDTIQLGPEDALYYALTQEQIDDLMLFVSGRRELFPYIPEAWDCDDFAHEFQYLSRVWNVRRLQGAPIAPAVCVIYARLDGPYELFAGEPYVSGVYHAFNAVLRNDGQWFFIEPQNGRLVPIDSMIYEGTVEVIKIQI